MKLQILQTLLNGGSIRTYATAHNIHPMYRLCDAAGNPVLKFYNGTWLQLRKLLRRDPRNRLIYILNRQAVRKLHGNCLAKKLYRDATKHSPTN